MRDYLTIILTLVAGAILSSSHLFGQFVIDPYKFAAEPGDPLSDIKTGLVSWYDMADSGIQDITDQHGANDLAENGVNLSYSGGTGTVDAEDSRWDGPSSHGWLPSAGDGTFSVRFRVNGAIVAGSYVIAIQNFATQLRIGVFGAETRIRIYGLGPDTTDARSVDTWYLVICRATSNGGGGADVVDALINDAPPTVSSANGTLSATLPSGGAFIGRGNTTNGADGIEIDWIGFWNRRLTDAECTALYNLGATIEYTDLP